MKKLVKNYFIGFVFPLLILLLLELLVLIKVIPKLFLPPPSEVFSSFGRILGMSTFWVDLSSSLYRMLTGFLIGSFLGIIFGTIIGSFRTAHKLFDPIVQFLRPIPSVAIIPAAILLLGIGDLMKIFIISYAVIWPVLINTADGIRNVDPIQIDTGKVFGLKRNSIIKNILLPNAAPLIVTGFRISLAIALILTIVSEMVSGTNGLGLFILNSQRNFEIADMYAGILTVALLGFILNSAFVRLERKYLKWHKELTVQIN